MQQPKFEKGDVVVVKNFWRQKQTGIILDTFASTENGKTKVSYYVGSRPHLKGNQSPFGDKEMEWYPEDKVALQETPGEIFKRMLKCK